MARALENLARPAAADSEAAPSTASATDASDGPTRWPDLPGSIDWNDEESGARPVSTNPPPPGQKAESLVSTAEPTLTVSEEFFVPENSLPPPYRDFSDLDSLAAASVSVDPRRRKLARWAVVYVMAAMGILLLVAGVVATVKSSREARRQAVIDGAWVTQLGGRLYAAVAPQPQEPVELEPSLPAPTVAQPVSPEPTVAEPAPKPRATRATKRRAASAPSKAALLSAKNAKSSKPLSAQASSSSKSTSRKSVSTPRLPKR